MINVKWENGKLLFDENWRMFTKEANLEVGDICVMSRTTDLHKFKLTILHNNQLQKNKGKGNVLLVKFY